MNNGIGSNYLWIILVIIVVALFVFIGPISRFTGSASTITTSTVTATPATTSVSSTTGTTAPVAPVTTTPSTTGTAPATSAVSTAPATTAPSTTIESPSKNCYDLNSDGNVDVIDALVFRQIVNELINALNEEEGFSNCDMNELKKVFMPDNLAVPVEVSNFEGEITNRNLGIDSETVAEIYDSILEEASAYSNGGQE